MVRSLSLRRVVVSAAGLLMLACGGPVPAPTVVAPVSTSVVVVSAAGRLVTPTPAGAIERVPPTPTFDPGFGSILTPLAEVDPAATPSPAPPSPTADLRPTRTPAPSVTPFPTLELPPPPERPVFVNPPPRTPGPPTATPRPRPTVPPTRTPMPTPVDPTGSNSDLTSALPISIGEDQKGLLNGPTAVDVFSFDVLKEEARIEVTLTAQDAAGHRLYVISPGLSQSAFGTPVGATGRRVVLPTRGEIGTWYVEVSADGKRAPKGGYTLKVDVRETLPVADSESG